MLWEFEYNVEMIKVEGGIIYKLKGKLMQKVMDEGEMEI